MRWVVAVLAIAVVTLVALVVVGRLWPGNRMAYAEFTSPELHVRFNYPAGWRVQEVPKTSTTLGEIQIFGPRREELQYSLFLDLTVKPLTETGPKTLEEASSESLKEQRTLPRFQLLDERAVRCGHTAARQRRISYELQLPLYGAAQKPVTIHELSLTCLHGSRLYQLSYAAPADDFSNYEQAFHRFVRSFTILP